MNNETTQKIDAEVKAIRDQHGVFCWHQNNRLKEFCMDLCRTDGACWFDVAEYVEAEHGILI